MLIGHTCDPVRHHPCDVTSPRQGEIDRVSVAARDRHRCSVDEQAVRGNARAKAEHLAHVGIRIRRVQIVGAWLQVQRVVPVASVLAELPTYPGTVHAPTVYETLAPDANSCPFEASVTVPVIVPVVWAARIEGMSTEVTSDTASILPRIMRLRNRAVF